MNPYSSFQLADAFKPYLGDSRATQTVQQYWLHGCDQVQQNLMRHTRGLFGHYHALLRESQSLQNSVLARYIDWVRDWTSAPVDRPSSAEKLLPQTTSQPAAPAKKLLVEDDLTRIQGVGGVVQRRLNLVGVVSFRQIATWTNTEIAYIENNVLGSAFADCVSREQWQTQAKEFLKDA